MTDDDHLKRINALTSNARQTWFALLAALVFVGITLMGVEHIDFYGVDRATTLPLVNVEVPTRLFFIAAPILIAAIYGYFHLYLIRLFDALGAAPVRVNKIRLGDAVAPWLVSDAALAYRARRRQDNSTTPRVLEGPAAALNLLLAWGFGLIVLGWLYWQSLPARSFLLSAIALASFTISMVTGIGSQVTLRRRLGLAGPADIVGKFNSTFKDFSLLFFVIAFGLSTYLLTEGPTNNLVRIDLSGENIVDRPAGWLPHAIAREEFLATWCKRTGAPCQLFEMDPAQREAFEGEWANRRKITLADLRKPAWHRPHPNAADIDFRDANLAESFLPGTNLSKAQMQGAYLNGAQLEGAYLDGAQLQGAVLSFAEMAGAILSGAQLEGAVMSGTQLQGATMMNLQIPGMDLNDANLAGADLRDANLHQAELIRAQMQGAFFGLAQMQGANLGLAQMQGADLREAQMEGANLNGAQMQGAILRVVSMREAVLRGAQMQGADLFRAYMEEADLSGAQMQEADLRWAQMQGADLSGAQLQGAFLINAQMEGADFSLSSLTGRNVNQNVLDLTNLSRAKNNGGMLRFVDLTDAVFDDETDFRNAFLDGSVEITNEFRTLMDDPCQWVAEELDDTAFYGRWRGWVEAAPSDFRVPSWSFVAPEGFDDVTPIPPPPGCEWKTEPISGAEAE